MADIDLDRLQALHDAATPGPWFGTWDIINEHGDPIARTDVSLASNPFEADNDGPLIVAMRNALPSLLAELRELRAEREKTEAALRALSAWAAMWDAIRPTTGAVKHVTDLGLWREPKETP